MEIRTRNLTRSQLLEMDYELDNNDLESYYIREFIAQAPHDLQAKVVGHGGQDFSLHISIDLISLEDTSEFGNLKKNSNVGSLDLELNLHTEVIRKEDGTSSYMTDIDESQEVRKFKIPEKLLNFFIPNKGESFGIKTRIDKEKGIILFFDLTNKILYQSVNITADGSKSIAQDLHNTLITINMNQIKYIRDSI